MNFDHEAGELNMSMSSSETKLRIAVSQSQMLMAQNRPRNEDTAVLNINAACSRERFAVESQYPVIRGGKIVQYGPSIVFAEAMAMYWRNLVHGYAEERGKGESSVICYALDLENNVQVVRTIAVPHWRYTRSGGYPLQSEDDISALIANRASRARRSCILALIPRDIVDEACELAEQTILTAIGGELKQAVKKVISSFEGIGIQSGDLAKFLQRKITTMTPRDVIGLRMVYKSIQNGLMEPWEIFEGSAIAVGQAPAQKMENTVVIEDQKEKKAYNPKKLINAFSQRGITEEMLQMIAGKPLTDLSKAEIQKLRDLNNDLRSGKIVTEEIPQLIEFFSREEKDPSVEVEQSESEEEDHQAVEPELVHYGSVETYESRIDAAQTFEELNSLELEVEESSLSSEVIDDLLNLISDKAEEVSGQIKKDSGRPVNVA